MKATGSGKIVLAGEHSVVYGRPAIVAGIDRSIWVEARISPGNQTLLSFSHGAKRQSLHEAGDVGTAVRRVIAEIADQPVCFELEIHSQLPESVGLGSSAALCVAVARSVGQLLGRSLSLFEVEAAADRGERVFHGRPSGMDVKAAARGQVLWFDSKKSVHQIALARHPRLVVAVMCPAPPTHLMLDAVRDLVRAEPRATQNLFDEMGAIAESARDALQRDDMAELGQLMSANQSLLSRLLVSTPLLDAACQTALKAGALGAKLTGAGGGGSIIVLAPGRERIITEVLEKAGARQVFVVRTSNQD